MKTYVNTRRNKQRHPFTANRYGVFGFALCLVLLFNVSSAFAQDATSQSSGRFKVGMQSFSASLGISGSMDITDRITAQGVADLFGNLTSLYGRATYSFYQQEKFDVYAWGLLGTWRVRVDTPFGTGPSVGGMAYGAGAGLDLDLQALLAASVERFPAVSASIEAGVAAAQMAGAQGATFGIGFGLHYRF